MIKYQTYRTNLALGHLAEGAQVFVVHPDDTLEPMTDPKEISDNDGHLWMIYIKDRHEVLGRGELETL